MSPDALLTREDVAELLQVSVRQVDRLDIPSVKLGRCRRYRRETVDDFIRDREAA